LLLRANWKRQLDNGWKLGLFGQVPVIDKTTFAPAGVDREFGIGDAAFQAAFSHDIDRRWLLALVLGWSPRPARTR
jgi:hypothetical protein